MTKVNSETVDDQTPKRSWEGIPVRDAEHELRVFPNADDIDGAVRGDEQYCVFARACRRLFGSTRVAFLRTGAYVELLDENGNKYIERFVLTEPARKAIAEFDKTGKANPGGFILSVPTASRKLEYQLEKTRRQTRAKREAALRGEILEPNRTIPPYERKQLSEAEWRDADSVRNSTGMIHFTNHAVGVKRRKKGK